MRMAACAAALLFAYSAAAASAHFSRISVERGLSQSSVESIAEDRFGFLWFGTQEGLNRFDGYRFTVHQPSARPGHLQDGFIRSITPDHAGNLWVGTATTLQNLDLATGRFSEPAAPDGIGVRLNTLRVAPDGRLWFAGMNGGLWTRAANQTGHAELVVVDGLGATAPVTAVALESANRLWIAASGQLLSLEVREKSGAISVTARVVLRDAGFIRVIHIRDGALWLGRQGAPLLELDPRSGRVIEHPALPRHVLTIASGKEGRLWIGGKGAGLTRFDPKTGETIVYRHEPGNETSLAENDVAVVHEDRGGSLWVGAWNGGLSRLNLYAQPFRTLRNTPGQVDSLPDDDVTSMAEGVDGRLWAISRNDVLAVGDVRSGSFATVPLQRDFTAIAAAGDAVYAGTTTGLVALDARSGRELALDEIARREDLHRVRIDGLAAHDQELWIVSGATLYRVTKDAVRRTALPLNEGLTYLHAASADRLWITYADGVLLRVDHAGGVLRVERVLEALTGARGRLVAVAEHRGVVWLGTALGIGRLAGNAVLWIEVERGMPSRSVAAIQIDALGALWIAASKGITRFDPASGRAVHFGAVEGAQPSGYVDAGGAIGRSGRFYLAGKGITVFDPREVVMNPYRPRVVFTSLEILHQPVEPSWLDPSSPLRAGIHAASEVTLDPDAVVFSVEMAAPGASNPDAVQYAHRLDGFDDEWIEATADRRVATYTRLAPGTYLLRARARTQSGVSSAEETTLRITILPPWWRTPAALVLWLVLAALAISALIVETRRRTRVRIALAEQEVLRRASVTDPLTGLYNRRFLDAWLKHEVPRTLRMPGETLLVVMADLDNLKEINDASGHDAGDRAIRTIADLLQTHARAGDLAVRWGGDEFMLVLRSIDRAEAGRVVERLRRNAEDLPGSRTTISLGFAAFPFLEHDPAALPWETTLQLADRALLVSKRRGRSAWTGFMAAPATTAGAVLAALESGAPSPAIRVVQGPADGVGIPLPPSR